MCGHGRQYIGLYKEGIKNGKGKRTFKNGDVIEGTFEDNYICNGTMTYYDGRRYEGRLVDRSPEGYGKMFSVDKKLIEEGESSECLILYFKIN